MNLKILMSSLCLLGATAVAVPVHAEWVNRITDGIMGTRITVELWSEDKAQADAAIDAVLDEMRPQRLVAYVRIAALACEMRVEARIARMRNDAAELRKAAANIEHTRARRNVAGHGDFEGKAPPAAGL